MYWHDWHDEVITQWQHLLHKKSYTMYKTHRMSRA